MTGIDTEFIGSYASGITDVVNGILVPLIFTICIIVFLYGVARAYIIGGASDTARAEGHKLILWGLIGFVVMLSVWGLVNILMYTFGLTGGLPPPLPKIPTS